MAKPPPKMTSNFDQIKAWAEVRCAESEAELTAWLESWTRLDRLHEGEIVKSARGAVLRVVNAERQMPNGVWFSNGLLYLSSWSSKN